MTEREISELVSATKIPVGKGSPLKSLPATSGRAGRGFPKGASSSSQHAIEILAEPAWELGVMLSHPWSDEPQWYYVSAQEPSSSVAWSKAEGAATSRDLSIIPLSTHQAAVASCLSLDSPCVSGMMRIDLSKHGFSALLAAVDGVRRAALDSLLNHRLPPPPIVLHLSEVGASFARILAAEDLRWTSATIARLSPVTLSSSPTDLASGMKELETAGLLAAELGNEVWRPVAGFHLVCEMLATPLACAGLSRRELNHPSDAVEHLVALRGAGSLWLFEFVDEPVRGSRVRVRDVSIEELDLVLSLKIWPQSSRTSQPVLESARSSSPPQSALVRKVKAEESPEVSCPSCRSPLKPGARFCTRCGAAINR